MFINSIDCYNLATWSTQHPEPTRNGALVYLLLLETAKHFEQNFADDLQASG